MDIKNYIEHTVLKADTSLKDIKRVSKEAIENEFYGLCIPPYFVKAAKKALQDSQVKIVTVIGFPLGYSTTPSKVEEAKKAIDEGADEIDMVINIAALKAKDYAYVTNDISTIFSIVHIKGAKLKVIIETALLTKEEKLKALEICAEVQVDFVKTSTGFAKSGAKIEDIILMRENLPKKIKIKASGGIKTKEQALALINAGANRLGVSSSLELIK
ncbi:MAG: deoxyribose-phosphate aldolase [Planctomycetota bacterium]|jgi:deoxyribose-phosphate aldolase